MRLCFISTTRGSPFMTELLEAISIEVEAAGHTVELAFDRFPEQVGDEEVYVHIPHELEAWGSPHGGPNRRQRERTIALCTENVGTEWFEATCRLLPKSATSVSINRASAAAVRRHGMSCEHIQLGYSSLWDSWHGETRLARPIDVLYLGAADPRRDPLVAGWGRELWGRECQLLVPPLEQRVAPRPDFLRGAEKYERLRASSLLLNLHRTTSAAAEWMRLLEAICNGCVVISEPCLDNEPLLPGEHFLVADAQAIAPLANRLLDEPERLSTLREAAYAFVREQLPMRTGAERLIDIAAELASPTGLRQSAQRSHDATEDLESERKPMPSLTPNPPSPAPADDLRGATAMSAAGRLRLRWERTYRTPAFASASPRVTVTVIVEAPDDDALETFASVAASRYEDLELLILDATANGRCSASIRSFLAAHPTLPGALVRKRDFRSPGRLRNVLARRARGEYLLALDSGEEIYPTTVERLLRALEADPDATFSYPMLVALDGEEPRELLSPLPWEPWRLGDGTWADTMMLIRTARLRALGGYATDPRLAGWEDLYLLCRCAQEGDRGVLVPQVLGSRPNVAERNLDAGWSLMSDCFPEQLGSALAA